MAALDRCQRTRCRSSRIARSACTAASGARQMGRVQLRHRERLLMALVAALRAVHSESTSRYKYVVQVFIGEQKGAGVR